MSPVVRIHEGSANPNALSARGDALMGDDFDFVNVVSAPSHGYAPSPVDDEAEQARLRQRVEKLVFKGDPYFRRP